LHVAIVKLRGSQDLDEDTILGVGKTLTQLRSLGLLSIVVLDCGLDQTRNFYDRQAFNICEAIDSFSRPASKLVSSIITRRPEQEPSQSASLLKDEVLVESTGALERALNNHLIPVIPSLACRDSISVPTPVDANQLVLAITKYLTGKQTQGVEETSGSNDSSLTQPRAIAAVERVIILDPLGGIPVTGRPGASHRFINLEQEFELLSRQLMGPDGSPVSKGSEIATSSTVHVSNLALAKEVLSILPPSSSALITTPYAAANMNGARNTASKAISTPVKGFGFNGMVVTRKKQNPLLHNLLTDKPVYSSSLPVQRVQDGGQTGASATNSTAATLLKQGMPLTMYPNPRANLWVPPKPGGQRLRLTDNCIDLPRLVYLIEDSFGRRLDVDDYLRRVNNNLAGVIIAGEYEGGAILTWEIPEGMDEEEAYRQGRLVPYLDKFAVLKSRQGSGGVADIVFNAMVRDCFPNGVCWRSRQNNPVNKWYFERSVGTNKLTETNWTMFWTTLGLDNQHPKLGDYESVCRSVQPSWADNKHIVD
jgi:amino-acid N-acetyltransferase